MPLKKFIENIADFGADGSLFGDAGKSPPSSRNCCAKTTTSNAAVNSPLDDYREFFSSSISRLRPTTRSRVSPRPSGT